MIFSFVTKDTYMFYINYWSNTVARVVDLMFSLVKCLKVFQLRILQRQSLHKVVPN